MFATPSPAGAPRLHGVHHTARPVWKLEETVRFYRDVLSLELLHVITARGWGQEGHPDFLHLFFDSGNGSTIAFFYYLGTSEPDYWTPDNRLINRSIHTAWAVPSREELLRWRVHLESHGYKVRQVRHEVVESIYVDDPNGYSVEIAWQCRPFAAVDKADAALTLKALAAVEEEARARGGKVQCIDEVWRRKGRDVDAIFDEASPC